MKKNITKAILMVCAILITAALALASSGIDYGTGQHSERIGNAIRETRVNGHHMEYRLIDMQKQIGGMEKQPALRGGDHLMVYVSRPDGTPVKGAIVGYMVTVPGQKTQKTMAMGMGGGYGADVALPEFKTATVSLKAMVDGQTLTDSFTYPAAQ